MSKELIAQGSASNSRGLSSATKGNFFSNLNNSQQKKWHKFLHIGLPCSTTARIPSSEHIITGNILVEADEMISVD
jgi:hypothetical protein